MYRILVLTDHSGHTAQNSLYGMCRALASDWLIRHVDVASRGLDCNAAFFAGESPSRLYVTPVTEYFGYDDQGAAFDIRIATKVDSYDIILLRMPPPISNEFLLWLTTIFPEDRIINRPTGILKTGSKAYLLEQADLCPPVAMLNGPHDVYRMMSEFPIVMKPLRAYGGKGIVKVQDGIATSDGQSQSIEQFLSVEGPDYFPILGMKYLRNVVAGDKRTIVVNGHIIGSVLRMPAENDWLCNISQGGSSRLSHPDRNEERIARILSNRLKKEGIIVYGFDTLVDDDGKRVLSELNTTSVGGIVHLERDETTDVLTGALNYLIDYIDLEIFAEKS